ncbi:pyridoxal-phosphate dependent enzyme [bacterium]|nr:pyridoxal-phosphate dependent enzyme [bacterium]
MLTLELISEAERTLKPVIRCTPIEASPVLSDLLGVPVWLKLENLQITGSFKARGAYFALKKAQSEGLNHIATCSAGNHGKGVAWASSLLGMKCTIFVPQSVDSTKLEGMIRYGAQVEKSMFDGYDETEVWAKAECERLSIPFISAFDDERVMAANGGTVGSEILHQVPGVTSVVLPLGGGGLSSGAAFYVKHHNPLCDIVLCQHVGCPAFNQSVEMGEAALQMPAIKTLASGLEGGIGVKTFEVLRTRTDSVQLVTESELRVAMKWMIEQHQLIVEGSAAVPIAALLNPDFPKPNGPLVVVISGRNVASSIVADILKT